MPLRPFELSDRFTATTGVVFMSGIQALARLPLEQARADARARLDTGGFISGYRGSPLGGLDKELWRIDALLKASSIYFQAGVNEELAATSVWGSQHVGLFPGARKQGVFGLWYGKAPGLDRATDALRHGNAAGTSPHGGVLLAVGDDHGCKSSTLPSHSELALADLNIPILNPATVQEVLEFGLFGWAMSRCSGLWVAMIALADTMDSASTVDLSALQRTFVAPSGVPLPAGGVHIRAQDHALAQEERLLRAKLPLAVAFARANGIDQVVLSARTPRIGIVTTGKAYLDTREALLELGIRDQTDIDRAGIALLKVGMPWPLDGQRLREFAQDLDALLVVEEKRPLVEDQLRAALYDLPRHPIIVGKRDAQGREQLPAFGELSPTLVARALSGLLAAGTMAGALRPQHDLSLRASADPASTEVDSTEVDSTEVDSTEVDAAESGSTQVNSIQVDAIQVDSIAVDSILVGQGDRHAARTPVFCAGCPHNTSTRLPEGSRALAGIGCHYMAQWIQPRTQTFTQMGGEGTPWIGQAPFTDENHVFANLGDGTYFHSGILAIRAAVAANVNITYKILFNDAVAMTGGQHVDGELTLDGLMRQLDAEGVREIAVVSAEEDQPRLLGERTVVPRGMLDEVQRRLRDVPGCTVLIYDQCCATELRRKRKRGQAPASPRRVVINDAVCEGCGDCTAQSGCVAVEPLITDTGLKRSINQTTCNQDFSCVRGFCPSFVSVYGAEPRTRLQNTGDIASLRARLAEPPLPSLDTPLSVVIAGVGGTGIVTISQLLGVAAHLDGHAVSTLDMTGLAQKGGAVFSHIRISARRDQLHATRVTPGRADLLIAADVITAASADGRQFLDPARTFSVVNTHLMPTANFVLRQRADLDSGNWVERIRRLSRAVDAVDADSLSVGYLGDATMANVLLLGYAYQTGRLPVSLAALERAIELNAVAVQNNLYAFHFGRLAAAQPEQVGAELPAQLGVMEPPGSDDTAALIARRSRMLGEYQNAAYAARFEQLVDAVATAEGRIPSAAGALTNAVARGLYKAMAYKDEYEVARLYSDGRFLRKLQDTFGADYRLEIHLSPPVLHRADSGRPGFPRKRRFGAWMLWAFKLLQHGKVLRGTWFDPLGFSLERRRERQWRERYCAIVREVADGLDGPRLPAALALVTLADRVRGFGPIKLAALARVEAELDVLLAAFRNGAPQATTLAA